MKFDILNVKGDKVGDATADKDIFGVTPNQNAVRQAVLSELNNMRQGTHSSKNRALVNGGGKKPFKQKGRGGARAGTIRSPLWKGGGTVFGPEPHSYNHKLPKKLSKLARRSVLSSKAAEGNLIVIDEFSMESHKTSEFVSILKKLKLQDKKLTLLTSEKGNGNLDMSVRNLYNVSLVDYRKASTYDMIDCDLLIIDNNSIKMLAEMLKD
jgi:large subunit ribosomal protein L4